LSAIVTVAVAVAPSVTPEADKCERVMVNVSGPSTSVSFRMGMEMVLEGYDVGVAVAVDVADPDLGSVDVLEGDVHRRGESGRSGEEQGDLSVGAAADKVCHDHIRAAVLVEVPRHDLLDGAAGPGGPAVEEREPPVAVKRILAHDMDLAVGDSRGDLDARSRQEVTGREDDVLGRDGRLGRVREIPGAVVEDY
jgi:hypothetical protein